MNAFSKAVAEIYITSDTLMQNFDASSTTVMEYERTTMRTDKRKDENYIPIGINACEIIRSENIELLRFKMSKM